MKLDKFAKKGTTNRKIIDMHHRGWAASDIDKKLRLVPGYAHDVICRYWYACI